MRLIKHHAVQPGLVRHDLGDLHKTGCNHADNVSDKFVRRCFARFDARRNARCSLPIAEHLQCFIAACVVLSGIDDGIPGDDPASVAQLQLSTQPGASKIAVLMVFLVEASELPGLALAHLECAAVTVQRDVIDGATKLPGTMSGVLGHALAVAEFVIFVEAHDLFNRHLAEEEILCGIDTGDGRHHVREVVVNALFPAWTGMSAALTLERETNGPALAFAACADTGHFVSVFVIDRIRVFVVVTAWTLDAQLKAQQIRKDQGVVLD